MTEGMLGGRGRMFPVAWSLIAALHLSACGDAEDEAVLVLAASGLVVAFEELVPVYEARSGERVRTVMGSSGNLAAQIRNGAPADLFFSADEGFFDGLVEDGSVDADSRTVYATGRLALVAPPGAPTPEGVQVLTRAPPASGLVAIANPDHAPYGRAAREVLQRIGVWGDLGNRLVLGESVAHALQFVRTGNTELGLVALSLVRGAPGDPVPHVLIDEGLHVPLRQVAGVVRGRSPERVARARAFLDFVMSPEGQAMLARHGFDPPETR